MDLLQYSSSGVQSSNSSISEAKREFGGGGVLCCLVLEAQSDKCWKGEQ